MFTYMSVHEACAWCPGVCGIPWEWSYKQELQMVVIYPVVLGIEHRSSGRPASVLFHELFPSLGRAFASIS